MHACAHTPTQWIPEINHHAPNVPILLVGTKMDTREDETELARLRDRRQQPITFPEGSQLAKEIGAVK